MAKNDHIDNTDTKAGKTLQEQSLHTDCLRRCTAVGMISELIYINVKYFTSTTVKIFYHSKSTGVHLGLITKLIESDIFLSGF